LASAACSGIFRTFLARNARHSDTTTIIATTVLAVMSPVAHAV